jgi:NCAIR mutase (PurE)-related protein
VTNIDNGFGAACAADAILRLLEKRVQSEKESSR